MKLSTITKNIAGFATGAGASYVVGNAIKATTPPAISIPAQILAAVGGYAVSSLVGTTVQEQTEKTIDEFADAFGDKKVIVEKSEED